MLRAVCGQWFGDHALSGRLARPVGLPRVGPILGLVFHQTVRDHGWVYLGARHAAAPADGPAYGIGVETNAADGAREYARRRRVAIYAGGRGALDRLLVSGRSPLFGIGTSAGRAESNGQTHLSIC